MDIDGILTILDKIWFNDCERCRLRICGFTPEQVKLLKNADFIDISIIDTIDTDKKRNVFKCIIYISTSDNGNIERCPS